MSVDLKGWGTVEKHAGGHVLQTDWTVIARAMEMGTHTVMSFFFKKGGWASRNFRWPWLHQPVRAAPRS